MLERILVVEDEPVAAMDAQLRLQRLGYQVIGPFSTAEEALHEASVGKPDLALVDILLPGLHDGIVIARMLKRLSIPVVFMTGARDPRLIERARSLDPYGFLSKPLKQDELEDTLRVALSRSEIARKLALCEQLMKPE